MRQLFAVLAMAGMFSAAASAQYFARGEFNGWGTDNPLTDQGGGVWSGSVTGLTPGQEFEYKLANEDWSFSAPSSNGKVPADANGEIEFYLYPNDTWADGWMPDAKPRVGYADPQQFGWDIMGAFNDWTGPVVELVDQGNGLWTGEIVVADPGTYEWKFRKAGDWSISIGDDFGNAAANNAYTTSSPDEPVRFELDLPGGRWRAVPEPATAVLLAVGAAALIRRRR